jgi:prepilin-type processing-associated H-X9-DG protein
LGGNETGASYANATKAINCTNEGEPYSLHNGGLNLLRGDGSVVFLNENVTVGIVAALITRAFGEVIPSDL